MDFASRHTGSSESLPGMQSPQVTPKSLNQHVHFNRCILENEKQRLHGIMGSLGSGINFETIAFAQPARHYQALYTVPGN